jgi:hypothetical protein
LGLQRIALMLLAIPAIFRIYTVSVLFHLGPMELGGIRDAGTLVIILIHAGELNGTI